MRLTLNLAFVLGLSAILTSACAASPDASDEAPEVDESGVSALSNGLPIGHGGGLATDSKSPSSSQAPSGAATTNGISYHGGPVMTNPVNLYYIWYGNWSGNSATTILTDLARSLGGSPYWHINTTYKNAQGVAVSNTVAYKGSTTDNYSKGKSLSDSQILSIVSTAITNGKLPKDANGIYFVLTSADVTASSGFCSKYCGWHSNGTIGGTDIKYSFVGNAATKCAASCGATSPSPNGNPGADGMASVIAHEAEETATDPDLNAWYDANGEENADKCSWKFGTTYTANGAKANMKLGTRNFYIQQNWVNANGGSCALRY
jgi:Phosphate-induced protein 1 conserved region